jgi:hypothetical protein
MMIGNKLLRASKAHFLARKECTEAKLTVYLSNPVGVGEHPDVVGEVIKLIEDVHDADGCIKTLDSIIEQLKEPAKD